MSNAVPWSTEVRRIGRPSVTLTPLMAPRRRFSVDVEAEQLDRDVAPIVEHGDDGVELLRAQLDEHGVAPEPAR